MVNEIFIYYSKNKINRHNNNSQIEISRTDNIIMKIHSLYKGMRRKTLIKLLEL